jgi:ribosome-binding protein aMBF1 (putative translation factor)
VGTREQANLARLSAELERLAGELGRLGGDPVPEAPPIKGERASDRLRRLLHEARRARGLRQCDLAERLGRPQSFVSNYERGTRRLEVSEFIEIARFLSLDAAAVVAELAGRDGEEEQSPEAEEQPPEEE